jgi:predicted ATPase
MAEAERCYTQSLQMARRQKAHALELQAAISLARLWRLHGRTQEAGDLLAPICERFIEGFDTRDAVEAKALLDEIARAGVPT